MGKLDKLREIANIATPIAQQFVPGGIGSILEKAVTALNKSSGPSGDAIIELANNVDSYNHEQDRAILSLHERVKVLENAKS